MMCQESASSATTWAMEEFGHADLGDRRRTTRLRGMAAQAALYPSGKVSEVFQLDAERQGAYDFLESPHIHHEPIAHAMGIATARRCADEPYVFAAVDGSSITLTDRARNKDFGAVGSYARGARGMKVICALTISPHGVPLGLSSMQWWAREPTKRRKGSPRKLEEKELVYWERACNETVQRFNVEAPECRLWFQLDREADAWQLLLPLSENGHWFTVRGKANRRIMTETGARRYVLDELARPKARKGTFLLDVSAVPGRTARHARVTVSVAPVTLALRDRSSGRSRMLPVYAVRARESSPIPAGEKPIEWLLYTNRAVHSFAEARDVVYGYSQRWCIEEFFRTWKTGQCNVESTQLQGKQQVTVWATMLAAIAARIERLKQLARTKPELPATEELAAHEVRALVLLKQNRKKKNEKLPRGVPTIAQAVLWIAELGGYTGKSSGGPPGSVTIGRGLERLAPAAEMVRALQARDEI
jgi:hypothetical protein